MTWNNQDISLYHGTVDVCVSNIPGSGKLEYNTGGHGILIQRGNRMAEFGRGFYTTTNVDQAKRWANVQLIRLVSRRRTTINPLAIVIKYTLNRNDLSQLNHLSFVRDTSDYWSFIMHCRKGGAHRPNNGPQYDIIYGPVSKRGNNIIKDSDQVSFHTPAALHIIRPPTMIISGTPFL